MNIARVSVTRPVLSAVISLTLIVLGVAALLSTQVRQYPDVDPPVVSVTTFYRGAPAQVVDSEITKRILDELAGVEDIRYVDARSFDEQSQIDVEFDLDRDLDLASAEVRERISRVLDEFPEEVDDSIVRKASASSSPILWLSLTSDRLSALELSDFADRQLEERLSILPGVAQVRIGGERRYAIRVDLNAAKLASRGVTATDVATRLREENIEVASGRIEGPARELTVRARSRLPTPDEFERLILRYDPTGPVRLGDVATVYLGAEEYRNAFRRDGKEGVGLGIVRQNDANDIAVADAVLEELETIRETLPPGVELNVSSDDSQFIRASVREVVSALIQSIGLVMLVNLVFLKSLRLTLVPLATVPAAVIGAAVVLYAFGYSINVLTLLAAVLAIGLVVDDAVVVLENTQRRMTSYGEPPLLAAERGLGQVVLANVATTVVLVAVFVPMAFLTGRVGRLFGEFAVYLAGAQILSLLIGLTLCPMLASKLLRDPNEKRDDKPGRVRRGWQRSTAWAGPITQRIRGAGNRINGWAGKVRDGYGRTVGGAIRFRWITLVVMLLISGVAYLLFNLLESELTPPEDQGRILVRLEGPEGSSVDYTAAQVRRVEAVFEEKYGGDDGPLQSILTIVPGFGGGESANTGVLIVRLKDFAERETGAIQIVDEIQPLLRQQIPGARAFAITPPGLGLRSLNQPVQFVVGGPDFDSAARWATTVLEAGQASGLFTDLRSNIDPVKPQYTLTFDRERIANLGVSVGEIGTALQAFLGGLEVTEFLDRGEVYEVVLQAPRADRQSPADLDNIYVRSGAGALVPVSNLLRVSEEGVPLELRRVDRQPSYVLEGGLAPGVALGEALERLEEIAREQLPPEARINYLGESLEFKDSGSELYVTFGLGLVLVYLALAAQFGSFVHPATILVTVPLAVTGALASLLVFGLTLNIYSQIGMILLVGLATKNGILLVDFANQYRNRGMSPADAARKSAETRLRPILMTSISAVLGALPLLIATGAGAEGRVAIGLVTAGGALFSTLLTLYAVPAVYVLLAGLTRPTDYDVDRLDKQAADHPPPEDENEEAAATDEGRQQGGNARAS